MLSDRDLLLLSNFMYADISATSDKSMIELLDSYTKNGVITTDKLAHVIVTIGMSKENMAIVMNEMRKSDAIKKLTIDSSINDGIRGACFVDRESCETTVAFRGTGGSYGQWKSNLNAFNAVSVKEQEQATEFIRRLKFDHITVTGHSKGGNLAMFATITLGSRIDRCVSFEGQGFSRRFITEYAAQIRDDNSKIISVSSSCDPVSALLHSVAGERCYIKTSGMYSHSPFILLTKTEFDKNGNIADISKTKPAKHLSGIYMASTKLTDLFG